MGKNMYALDDESLAIVKNQMEQTFWLPGMQTTDLKLNEDNNGGKT